VSEGEIQVLYRKMDRTNEELHEMDKRMTVLEKSSADHDEQFRSMNILISQNHAKITNLLEGIAATVNELSNDYQQRVGVKNFVIKWAIPVASVVVAVAAIYNSAPK
tara:strand:+ start:198 stop:518 length:321 start_codon:yes stop_codon:yes gene_type:complete